MWSKSSVFMAAVVSAEEVASARETLGVKRQETLLLLTPPFTTSEIMGRTVAGQTGKTKGFYLRPKRGARGIAECGAGQGATTLITVLRHLV